MMYMEKEVHLQTIRSRSLEKNATNSGKCQFGIVEN